jgi:hypothetical protein
VDTAPSQRRNNGVSSPQRLTTASFGFARTLWLRHDGVPLVNSLTRRFAVGTRFSDNSYCKMLIDNNFIFADEAHLVAVFRKHLVGYDAEWGVSYLAEQFDYGRGRTDLVASSPEGTVFAFEAKLHRWREALHQAYRNRCFAHCSYVVVPSAMGQMISRNIAEFRKRNVGVFLVSQGEVIAIIPAVCAPPIQPNLCSEALFFVQSGECLDQAMRLRESQSLSASHVVGNITGSPGAARLKRFSKSRRVPVNP